MHKLLESALRILNELDVANASNKERHAAHIIHQLTEQVKYLEERDIVSEKRIEVLRQLNYKYREHVMKLIEDTDVLRDEMKDLASSKFASL